MHYLNSSINWEEFFIQEALELEEKMKTLDTIELDKPKLLLALEHHILDWQKYESWATYHLGCASFKNNIDPSELSKFADVNKKTYELYSAFNIWDAQLIPFIEWDNKVYVLGLQYHDKLVSVENHVLLLTPPHVISYFYKKLFSSSEEIDLSFAATPVEAIAETPTAEAKPSFAIPTSNKNELEDLLASADAESSSEDGLEIESTGEAAESSSDDLILDFDVASPKIDFNSLSANPNNANTVTNASIKTKPAATTSAPPASAESATIWDYISERHEEYSFEAKKQFNAYIVLKIENNKTKVFKMDAELESENADKTLFEFDITQENPFKRVFDSGYSDSFSISQLRFQFKDYKYACITALKRGNQIVGFLLGLKESNLSESDTSLLEDLSKESA